MHSPAFNSKASTKPLMALRSTPAKSFISRQHQATRPPSPRNCIRACSAVRIQDVSLLSLIRDKERSALQLGLMQTQLCAPIAAATKAQIGARSKHHCGTARFVESFQLPLWSLESTFHISVWD